MEEMNIMLYVGAITLGALHAFEPGHGKTIIAAYMIATRGRAIDGLLLGFIVTFTHTFSVIILGVVARLLSHTYTETQLHAYLGLFSSVLILGVGIWMIVERLPGSKGHGHFHLFGKGHSHNDHHNHSHNHDHGDGHSPADHVHAPPTSPSAKQPAANKSIRHGFWNLLVLGISGGLVPCPAAIATLLAAIASGRTAQGLTLALFFSLGLGAVMMSIGVILSQAGRLTAKIGENLEFARHMGMTSAVLITGLGCYTFYHSLMGIFS